MPNYPEMIRSLEKQKASLRTELEKKTEDLKRREADRTLQIGMVGARGTTKSSWLAMLYGFPFRRLYWEEQSFDIDLAFDESSMVKVGKIYKCIVETGSASATSAGRPDMIWFERS